jgi:hypothetical protein
VSSSLFTSGQGESPEKLFGERYRGRYHMPLLPGEEGTKSGGDWVPYGLMSATNLAGSITDSRALSIWERERGQMGLALRPELFETLVMQVNLAIAAGADLDNLKDSVAGRALVATLAYLHDECRTAAGGNRAAAMGTNRHDVWEERARTGLLLGTPQINAEILALEQLLDAHGLERVPGLQERVVRNVGLQAAGRLDDVVMSRRTGRLYVADLKTKRKPFFSWLETWIQQAVYATAEWMLDDPKTGYIPGPKHHVDQKSSILLRMPSDGAPPFLQRVDLEIGARWAHIAKLVVDSRSEARSASTMALTVWDEQKQIESEGRDDETQHVGQVLVQQR